MHAAGLLVRPVFLVSEHGCDCNVRPKLAISDLGTMAPVSKTCHGAQDIGRRYLLSSTIFGGIEDTTPSLALLPCLARSQHTQH